MATRSWIFPAPSTTDIDDAPALRIEVMAGSVEVRRHDLAHTHVAVDGVSGPPVRMTLDAEHLLVSHAPAGVEGFVRRMLPSRASGRVRLRVFVPDGVPVSVSGGAAEVSAADLTEDAELTATSGRINTFACGAALHLRSRSGDLVVRRHEGDLSLSTATGRSDVEGRIPVAEMSTGTGDVWVVNAAASSQMRVASLAGAVHLRVLPTTQVRLKAARLGGSATVDGHGIDLGAGGHVEGEGPDAADINVSMATGTLSVRRDAEVR